MSGKIWDSRIASNKYPDMPSLKASFKNIESQFIGTPYLCSPGSFLGQYHIFIRQMKRLPRIRDTRKDEEPNHRHWDRENSVNYKKPSPPRHVRNT